MKIWIKKLLRVGLFYLASNLLTPALCASIAPKGPVVARPKPRPVPRPIPPRLQPVRPLQKPIPPVQQKVPETIEQLLDRQQKLEKELMPSLERKIVDKEGQIDALLKIADEVGAQEWYKQDFERLMQEKDKLISQRAPLLKQLEEVHVGIVKILGISEVKPKAAEKPKVEKSDIDVILQEYSRPAPGDGKLFVRSLAPDAKSEIKTYKNMTMQPKEFVNGLALVTQLGALSQKRGPEDYNNYCGYYAAYNLKCFLKGGDEKMIQARLLDRKAFSENFAAMLQEMKAAGHQMPYDNLQEEEIVKLMRAQGIADDQYVCLRLIFGHFGENVCDLTDVGRAYGHPELLGAILQVKYAEVEDFRAGLKSSLCILYNVGALHWLTIMVQRSDYGVHFYVADSLGVVDWTSDVLIKERLEPLYRFIIGE